MQGNFIYFFYTFDKELLYVGKTTNLRSRMRQHFSKDSVELESWKNTVDRNNIIVHKCENPTDLDIYETFFINKYKPKCNVEKIFNYLPTFDLPYLESNVYSFKLERVRGTCFRDDIMRYLYLKDLDNLSDEDITELDDIKEAHPSMEKIVSRLGSSRIRSLAYNKTKILHEYQASSSKFKDLIRERVQTYFLVDNFYSYLEAKKYLQSVYLEYNIPRTPKGKNVNSYIRVKSINKLINGVQTNGFIRLADTQ